MPAPLVAAAALSLLGYHLTFDAEMGSQADMSQFINTFSNGDTRLYNNNEEENYVPYDLANPAQPFTFANGALTISATPVPSGGVSYTSGMLETSGIFAQGAGYFEMRAAMPAGQGFWPAFWILPFGGYYPEIDIMEQPNNSGTDSEYWTHTNTPTDSSGGFSDTGVDLFHGYHRYGFLWTANSIQYVFDGQLLGWPHDMPPAMAGLTMYMIANLAVSNQWGWAGAPVPGTSSSISIDYIRAFSMDPTVPAVSLEPISSPDGVDTTPVLTLPDPPVPSPIGAGLDTLVLQMAEDAYDGDAQFTVSVDGKPRGKVQTTTASHMLGQVQPFTIHGNFGNGKHTVGVAYTNDLSGNDGNRNLYLVGATINGTVVHNATLTENFNGTQTFNFCARPVAPITIGTGPDSLVLDISEDRAPKASAKYTISVDGVQQGGTQMAAALHGYGQTQTVTVNGSFGPSAHTVGINFINGAATADASTGLSLYVDALSYNGIAAQAPAAGMTVRGTTNVQTALQQPDTVVLSVAEDAWQGDAQASVTVDGTAMGTFTVTAPKASATPQTISLSGSFGGPAIAHSVVVNFLNDAYGTPGQDRNLYVQGISFDGNSVAGQTSLMRAGPVTFTVQPQTAAAVHAVR